MLQNYTPIDDLIQKYKKPETPLTHSKEGEPARRSETNTFHEIKEEQPTLDASDFLIKKNNTIHLPPDLSALGLKSVDADETPNFERVKLPLSDDKVIQGMHAPISSSLRWLATFATYLLLRAHLTLRVVHGKVVRVARRG